MVGVDAQLGEHCNFFLFRWENLEVPPPYGSATIRRRKNSHRSSLAQKKVLRPQMPKGKALKTCSTKRKTGYPANGLDFDPEDECAGEISEDGAESNSDSDESQADAREHYEKVGYENLTNSRIFLLIAFRKSKLRKPDAVLLGPQYQGSLVSRHDLNGRGESFSEGDEFPGLDEGESSSLEGYSIEHVVNEDDERGSDVATDDDSEDEVGEDERGTSDEEDKSEQEENMGSIRKGVRKEDDGVEDFDSSVTDGDSVTEGFENLSGENSDTDESSSSSPDEAPARTGISPPNDG